MNFRKKIFEKIARMVVPPWTFESRKTSISEVEPAANGRISGD
jgi:hypothetical protein